MRRHGSSGRGRGGCSLEAPLDPASRYPEDNLQDNNAGSQEEGGFMSRACDDDGPFGGSALTRPRRGRRRPRSSQKHTATLTSPCRCAASTGRCNCARDGPLTICAGVRFAGALFPRFTRRRTRTLLPLLPPPSSPAPSFVSFFPRLFIDPKYHPGRMVVLASKRVPAAAATVPFLRNGTRQPRGRRYTRYLPLHPMVITALLLL